MTLKKMAQNVLVLILTQSGLSLCHPSSANRLRDAGLYLIVALSLHSTSALALPATPIVVRYYYTPNDAVRYGYYEDLLNMVLKRTERNFGPFLIEKFTTPMSSARWNTEAIRGKIINVMWSNTGHSDLNEKMIPIPIPADRGVHGYRVFLIRADRQDEFNRIRTLDDLRHFVVGQGTNWGDNKILEYNGLPLRTATLYDSLFPMLEANRFDYFSRSILEAQFEIESFGSKYPDLKIESSLLLHYQFPVIFFVSKTDPVLAERIRSGMEVMAKDGSLKMLFDRYFQKSLASLKLKSRKVLELDNPYLPAFVPVSRHELWFNPLEDRQ